MSMKNDDESIIHIFLHSAVTEKLLKYSFFSLRSGSLLFPTDLSAVIAIVCTSVFADDRALCSSQTAPVSVSHAPSGPLSEVVEPRPDELTKFFRRQRTPSSPAGGSSRPQPRDPISLGSRGRDPDNPILCIRGIGTPGYISGSSVVICRANGKFSLIARSMVYTRKQCILPADTKTQAPQG